MENKKIFILVVTALILFGGPLFAQETPSNSGNALPSFELDNCMKYYKMDSVRIDIQPSKSDILAPEAINFLGTLENTNKFPITGGSLVVQIYRLEEGDSRVRNLVDEFFLDGNFNLVPDSKTNIDFKWQAPSVLKPGPYAAAVSLVLDKKIYMSGLPFSDAYAGAYAFFNVRNGNQIREVHVDKMNVYINGKIVSPTSSMPYGEGGKDIELKYYLVNSGPEMQKIKITKHLYNWDQLQNERGQASVQEVEVYPDKPFEVIEKISNLSEGVYYYSAEIVGQGGLKSIFRQRFGIGGNGPQAKVAFVTLNNFPAKKGEATYIVGCFHSTSYEKSFEGKVYLTLRDKNNNTVERLEYNGKITPLIMGFRQDFSFEQDYDELKLEAQVYDKQGILSERVELVYNCDAFKNQPDNLNISVDRGGIVKVKVMNKCNTGAKANVALEVMDESGKVIFYDPGYVTSEYAKKAKFKYNNKYKITARAGGIVRSIEYVHMEKDYTWAWILGAVLAAIAIAGGLAYKSKMEQRI